MVITIDCIVPGYFLVKLPTDERNSEARYFLSLSWHRVLLRSFLTINVGAEIYPFKAYLLHKIP